MKEKIHPSLKRTVFQDISSDFSLLTLSTIVSKETIQWKDGKTYPLVKVEVSSNSHPFYTGTQRAIETEGRAARFKRRYSRK